MFGRSLLRRAFGKLTTVEQAVGMVRSGDTLLSGGFGVCGVPNTLHAAAAARSDLKELTVVSNNTGLPDYGVGNLLTNGKVKRMVSSYLGTNKPFFKQYMEGMVELEITPQGTIAEKVRAGGKGIPAFWTATGVGTMVETGGFPIKYSASRKGQVELFSSPKETRVFQGNRYLLEEGIFADVAFVRAHKGDLKGNLSYRLAARNFNPDMATAARLVIAEVEELVDVGEIPPAHVHTPGVFVDWIVLADQSRPKPIEKLVLDDGNGLKFEGDQLRVTIAKRVAKEIKKGMSINMGIGIPTLVPFFVPESLEVIIHSENGILGVSGNPVPGKHDPDLVNASKETISVGKGASFFSSSDSFGMVRGGHIDLTILGAMEVSSQRDVANWYAPGTALKGMGGAMDLISGGAKVIIAMEHCTKDGRPKIVEACSLPVTAKNCCSMIVTELGVFDYSTDGRLTLLELQPGVDLEELRSKTGAKFITHSNLK